MNQLASRSSSLLVALVLATGLSLGSSHSAFAQDESGGIQQAMTPEQFKAAGLEKLSPTELAKLNEWLHGYREKTAKKAAAHEKLQLIVSRVDGVIRSIGTGQVIPLEDGSQWELTKTDVYFHGEADHPAAAAFKSFFGWKLRIVGVGEFYVIRAGRH